LVAISQWGRRWGARPRRSLCARHAGRMHVLFLTVDLCSLCLRIADPSTAMFVAAALFGDGAAGVVLRNIQGSDRGSGRGTVLAVGDHFWPNTEQIMGWDIKEDGFGVVLSPESPGLIRAKFMPALRGFLDASDMYLGDFSGFIMHPGGAKILKTIQKLLRLSTWGPFLYVVAHSSVRAS
jgi:alkylresorcinol/alkylpyrone synthase